MFQKTGRQQSFGSRTKYCDNDIIWYQGENGRNIYNAQVLNEDSQIVSIGRTLIVSDRAY